MVGYKLLIPPDTLRRHAHAMLTALFSLRSRFASFVTTTHRCLVRGIERDKVLRMCPTATGPIFKREKGEELPCPRKQSVSDVSIICEPQEKKLFNPTVIVPS